MAAQKPKKTDWIAIKAEYLKGGTSYRKLAEKHGVNPSTLEKRAKRESWGDDLRHVSAKVAAELPDVVAEEVIDEAAAWVKTSLRKARELMEQLPTSKADLEARTKIVPAGPILHTLPFANDAKDFKAIADALASIDKTARQALGLDAKKDGGEEGSDDPMDALTAAITRSQKLLQGGE